MKETNSGTQRRITGGGGEKGAALLSVALAASLREPEDLELRTEYSGYRKLQLPMPRDGRQ